MNRTRTRLELKWVLNERAAVEGELAAIAESVLRLAERQTHLTGVLHALNAVCERLATALALADIPGVRAHTRYGARGNCINWVRDVLKAAHPAAMDTASLTDKAAETFGLDLSTPYERERFRHNSLRTALRLLEAKGEVERMNPRAGGRCTAGVWRWAPPGCQLSTIVEQAKALEQR